MTDPLEGFWRALAISIPAETVVLALLLVVWPSWRGSHAERLDRVLAAGVLATALTLPYLWLVAPYYVRETNALLGYGEPLIALVETGVLVAVLRLSWGRAALCAVAANVTSYVIGVMTR